MSQESDNVQNHTLKDAKLRGEDGEVVNAAVESDHSYNKTTGPKEEDPIVLKKKKVT